MENQMLLLEVKEESALSDRDTLPLSGEKTFYVLLLPVLEGSFRATLHGARSNELQMCVESEGYRTSYGTPSRMEHVTHTRERGRVDFGLELVRVEADSSTDIVDVFDVRWWELIEGWLSMLVIEGGREVGIGLG
ncbi:hypothetical protein T459_09423 [Capsicum annuum]|uniref:Uncharacterized protein n=1 Tax=Capsicum annuum TaxID=4072 RepID=A0A2G2ZZB5_CAPAN|nr:hypothetical protein T459_09423 [Capsicum annuum]